ncbi:SDR family oxidoreductase [Rhodobacteraceae bacterium RKSG542]|uniref:SDR family oxidoreductase n=1 Tax=Pseudovibrio flavus TaxID=2529854 RepID=UPI0012BBDF88|nr:SDR family oxidoreductase [Pseudovibrio flavus]MTI17230.1 SDR family oxidoreductase [Pseudovibrio flavus]
MKLFVFGTGYSAKQFIRDHGHQFDWIGGTTRSASKFQELSELGVEPYLFDGLETSQPILEALAHASHILVSIAPDELGDPVLRFFRNAISQAKPQWMAYLSTVGVYGDHYGAWVDENSECRPASKRSVARAKAEQEWLDLAHDENLHLVIFRLAGIYGKGRNALVNLERGTAKRIIKHGQVFNRIHVEDISGALGASLNHSAGGTFNLSDDEPAPPQDVVTYAAELMGVEPPAEVAFEDAELSPMGRSFYSETKRCRNEKVKKALNYTFKYPTYREALDALWADGYN